MHERLVPRARADGGLETAFVDVHELLVPLPLRRKTVLAVEILRAYLRVRRLLRRADLATVVCELRAQEPDGKHVALEEQQARAAGVRLSRAVARSLGFLPVDSRCLQRSLVLTELLARRGIESTLVIGVRSEPEFGAHAWVERDEVPLLPTEGALYERLVCL